MFERLGRLVVARRRWVVAFAVVTLLIAGALGSGVASVLSAGGFDDPGSESSVTREVLEERFGVIDPNLVLLVSAGSGDVDSPTAAAAGTALTQELEAEEGVGQVLSYWTTGAPSFKSRDGSQALVLGVIEGDEDVARERIEELSPAYTRADGSFTVGVGGFEEIYRQMTHEIESDLVSAEMIAFPITLIALMVVFGSVIAGALPLAVGAMSIVGAMFILWVIAQLTQVSIFALNLVTMLGLGLAIDYSLFVVSRFREEMRNGLEPHDAVVRTVSTAGRTVAFSGVTVALSLAALLVFPLSFLRSFAYSGIAVVLLAALGATIFLPAVLALLGHRIDKLSLRRGARKPEGEGFWHRMAHFVMRRPVPIAVVVVAFLLVLGTPFLGVEFGQADDRTLPEGVPVRVVSDHLRENFDINTTNVIDVVAADVTAPVEVEAEISGFAAALSEIEHVAAVEGLTGTYVDGAAVAPAAPQSARFAADTGTWFSVVPTVEPFSEEARQLVHDLRAAEAPFDITVTGTAASFTDTRQALFDRVPLAAALIGLATFVLLFLMFGSVLVPLKAIALNLLSLTATFGALVWIFQEGHLADTLGFTPTGTIELTMPILMFCIAFGLSMDYEVFLLSRIKEEHDRTGDNTSSVALGLERTGGIVTAAALLLSIIFIAFATSGVTFIKMMGIGLTLAVLVDASLVRATLVPAFMRLAGDANWWAPKWMRRIHDRFGISEGGSESPVRAEPVTVEGSV